MYINQFVRCNLNIAGIENYAQVQASIPQCWSEPAMGNALRRDLEPPIVQQAAFDNIVSNNTYISIFYNLENMQIQLTLKKDNLERNLKINRFKTY